jgi:hypothetical protein
MNRLDFFLAAMKAGLYRRRAWVISAFSLVREGPEDWKRDPYPLRIVQTPSGHFYVNPENVGELLQIDGVSDPGIPPYHHKDRIKLAVGSVPNLTNHDVETTYGNLLANYITIIWPFGRKIDFQEGRFTPSKIEQIILPRLADDPKEGDPVPKTMAPAAQIYVSEYLNYCDSMFYIAGFTQLWVPAGTAKTMTAAPGIVELKQKLLEENKDRLHDPAVIAKIQAELVKFDREYLKGDPGENFLIGKKSFEVVRSKLFGMHGAEVGLAERVDVDLIENSLSQGWDIDKFDSMNNSLRAGSFNRGAQTELGGESVKWLLRASSNIRVAVDDCGSELGNEVETSNPDWLVGFSVVTKKGSELVTKENVDSYLGKRLVVRSPMFCKGPKTDYCKVCVGERLAANPTGLSTAISEYGSAFLSIYMAAAHGKALTLAKMDFKTAIQ